jgi:hypothetical protein
MKKTFCVIAVLSILLLSGFTVFSVSSDSIEAASSLTLYVGGTGPGNYSKIQDAINASSDGDTIFVYSGVYNENIRIEYTSVNLIGENIHTTIINSVENSTNIIVRYWPVNITGFTIQNGSAGILCQRDNIIISHNIIKNCGKGIKLDHVTHNIIIKNNHIINNNIGVFLIGQKGLSCESTGNYIIKNNFIENTKNAEFGYMSANTVQSNYWDDWIGIKIKFLRFLPYNPYGFKDFIDLLIQSFFNLDWDPAEEPYEIYI